MAHDSGWKWWLTFSFLPDSHRLHWHQLAWRTTKAHYEPAQRVIAVSKPAGPGSLAHEWFHALDHEASRLTTRHRHGFATESWPDAEHSRTAAGQFARALHDYGCLLRSLGLLKRSAKLDQRRPKSNPYWSTTRELAARAFEAWIRWRLAQMGIRNDYLVNIAPASRWNAADELGIGYPYPTLDELRAIDPKLSAVADAGRQLVPQWAPELYQKYRNLEHETGWTMFPGQSLAQRAAKGEAPRRPQQRGNNAP